jgi:hypothetical protein
MKQGTVPPVTALEYLDQLIQGQKRSFVKVQLFELETLRNLLLAEQKKKT